MHLISAILENSPVGLTLLFQGINEFVIALFVFFIKREKLHAK